jgi:hypothetical protein
VTFDLRVGCLNPIDSLSGQRARFYNLGYFAGFTDKDLEQTNWAAEEFECDQTNGKRVSKKIDIDPKQGMTDEKKRAKLLEAHGF